MAKVRESNLYNKLKKSFIIANSLIYFMQIKFI